MDVHTAQEHTPRTDDMSAAGRPRPQRRLPAALPLLLPLLLLTACQGGRAPEVDARTETSPPPRAAAAPVGEWLAGDLHVHSDHSSDGSFTRQGFGSYGNVSVADQIAQATRMGLDWLPITDHRTFDQHYSPQWTSDSLLLIEGEEANGGPHCTVHGAVDTLVQGADFPDTPRLRVLQQSVWAARGQNAVWIVAHPDDGHLDDAGDPNDNASAVGLHLIETWNRASHPDVELDYAETRWNRGWRFGLAGASDNHFRELWSIAGPGSPTTWVFAAAPTRRGVLEGLRAGRTTLSAGPLEPRLIVEADADGDGVYEALGGDALQARAGDTLSLRLRLERGAGTRVLVYAAPGRSAGPIAEFSGTGVDESFSLDWPVPAEPSWIRAEVRGPGFISGLEVATQAFEAGTAPDLSNQLRAAASPIFVAPLPQLAPQPERPAPADAGRDDGAALALGRPGAFTGFADVAVAGGRTHVVAEQHDEAGFSQVVYRGPGGAQTLSESGFARHPRVAAAGARVWVVWQDSAVSQAPLRGQILLRASGDGGESFGPVQALSSGAARVQHPDLAALPGGEVAVVWQDLEAGVFDIRYWDSASGAAIDLSHEGKQVQAPSPVDTRSALWPTSIRPAIVAWADGTLAVGWQDNRSDPNPLFTGTSPLLQEELTPVDAPETSPDDWEIWLRWRDAAGAWSAPQNLSADATQSDQHLALLALADGTLLAAWDRRGVDGQSGRDTEVAWVQAGLQGPLSAAQAVPGDAPGLGQWPALGRDAAGQPRLLWADTRGADWRWRLAASAFTAGRFAAPELLAGQGNLHFPRLAQGQLVYHSDRGAAPQRDRTQQVWLRGL